MTNSKSMGPILATLLLALVSAQSQAQPVQRDDSELHRASTLWHDGVEALQRGSYADSERLIREALAIRFRLLGNDHYQTAQARNDLGATLFYQSKFTEAEAQYKDALTAFSHDSGHLADRAATLGNLASLYREQRKLAESEALYDQAFEVMKQPGAVNDLVRASILNDYAALQKAKGDSAAAMKAIEECVSIRERKLPPNNPHVIAAWTSLGDLYYSQRQYGRAEELFRKAAATCEQSVGKNERTCAAAYNGLALTLSVRGLKDEANRLFERALAIFERAYGPDHPRTGAVLNNIGTLADSRGDLKRAEKYMLRALDVWTKVYGPEHPDVASANSNLGSVYLKKNQFAKAEPLFQRALAVDEKIFGPVHDKVAVDLNNLAALYNDLQRFDEAEQYFIRAETILEKLPKSYELGYAGLLANHAAMRVNRGKLTDAASLYKRALKIYESNPLNQTPSVAAAFEHYADVMRKLKEPAEAQRAEVAAMRIRVQTAIGNERIQSAFAGQR